MKRITSIVAFFFLSTLVFAQDQDWKGKFEQLGTDLPTPNEYRTGSGAPGKEYWQQRADYEMDIVLDDTRQTITGKETITYFNQSPDNLRYLWVQLDQNVREKNTNSLKTRTGSLQDSSFARSTARSLGMVDYDGGFKIKSLTDANGNKLPYIINKTMMRIDLPTVLKSGENVSFNIEWSYNINDRMLVGGRSGYEYFPEEDNYLYTIAQFYPRMAVYDDFEGWQNKQFLGSGEFALTFGNFEVNITVPEDHIVASTGTIQNPKDVLTKTQLSRYEEAKKSFDKPVIIVTEEEAREAEKKKASKTKTWTYQADNVRDFAFATSRKFIWDAQAVKIGDKTPLAMSYYPKEGNPLWEEESTKAVVATLKTFSKYTVDYPYPVAISVHTASIGMEYPMICFNFGRPNPDGTVPDRTKYRMIGVIIHEVGHNFFPMIINSDERQWTWMDEGLTTFVQHRTQVEQYENFPSRRGTPSSIVDYMKGDKKYIRPIMTNSEQVIQFGNNAYAKPATALSILRETVMGPELFDAAFKEYAQRWAFKHPKPADFFRTMEDASAVDLDWFWKGWFYTNDHVDIAVDEVKWFQMRKEEADVENKGKKVKKGDLNANASGDEMMDFSDGPQPYSLVETPDRWYGEFKNRLDEKNVIAQMQDMNLYEVKFKNKGGLVMPVIIEFTFADGSKTIERLPAEIWRKNEDEISKVFAFEKEVTNIILDPNLETADTDVTDNVFPRKVEKSKFDQFQEKSGK